jgi:hypothetical protein
METAFLEQLFNIAQRKRVAKMPPDGTKDEAGFGLPPLEDRGWGYHFAILSRHQPATLNVATHPFGPLLDFRIVQSELVSNTFSIEMETSKPGLFIDVSIISDFEFGFFISDSITVETITPEPGCAGLVTSGIFTIASMSQRKRWRRHL